MKKEYKPLNMRISIMDRTVFSVMASACIGELLGEHPEWNGRAIRKNARGRFLQMMKDTKASIFSFSIENYALGVSEESVTFDPAAFPGATIVDKR